MCKFPKSITHVLLFFAEIVKKAFASANIHFIRLIKSHTFVASNNSSNILNYSNIQL